MHKGNILMATMYLVENGIHQFIFINIFKYIFVSKNTSDINNNNEAEINICNKIKYLASQVLRLMLN
jgi:hypothetical protein